MNVVYILFKKNLEHWWSAPFVVEVFGKEEDAYERKQQMAEPAEYFVEEWEIQ